MTEIPIAEVTLNPTRSKEGTMIVPPPIPKSAEAIPENNPSNAKNRFSIQKTPNKKEKILKYAKTSQGERMRFEIYPRFLQIAIKDDFPFLEKILQNAKKHFHQIHRLSNTLLILDDSRIFKKKYFLNWLLHLQDGGCEARVLEHAHLPIRIKIDTRESLLYQIEARMRILGHDRVEILLSKEDLKARRCLLGIFERYICSNEELLLDSSKEGFWEYLMEIVHSRVVGNLILNLSFQDYSYMTQSEMRLESCYGILDSYMGESLPQVRKKYLQLAKKYHPDNVFGADSNTIKTYQKKFIQIQDAFEKICASLN